MIALLAALATQAITSCLAAEPNSVAATYREPWRPQYHFTPATNWMNDPNGMVFYDGEYHLFYQYNPWGAKWGHMSWGHAVSRDLVRWEHLPVALFEEDGVMIFSGSAVVDWQNSSGFGRDGRPPLVALYTGHYTNKPLQNQHLAYSTDRGRTWTKYSGNPVLDIGEKDFRDPKVRWHASTKRWIMTVARPVERKIRFYASPDLKAWTHLSDFGPAGSTTGIWECPDLFPMRVAGGRGGEKWVLIVNVGSGAPAGGSGCQYFVGDFDGQKFALDRSVASAGSTNWADFGPDFYAAVSWSDLDKRDGRQVWLGWMSNWQYANDVPTAPWRSAMSIPRELTLRSTAEGFRLLQNPVRELKKLRGPRQRFKGSVIRANAWLKEHRFPGERTDLMEMVCEFPGATRGQQALKLFQSTTAETAVGIDRDRGEVFVDRSRSGNVSFHRAFPGRHGASVSNPTDRVTLRIFVDAGSVEVFVNDGELALSCLVLPAEDARGLEVIGPAGTDGQDVGLELWPLKSTWR